ncbi:MAG TPA: hypothetical protein VMY42_14820 [Thermoguttaceae bacterium]|nr:hypothetical protein [Thermoguttaceae bacterium]
MKRTMPGIVCFAVCFPGLVAVAQIADAEEDTTARIPARPRYLLLDSRIVEKTENARLAVGAVKKHPGNPLFAEDKPWEPRFDNLYANVIYDRLQKRYQCWYSPFIVDEAVSRTPREERRDVRYRPRGREMGVCFATSKDGLEWERPELGLVEFQGSKANNLVIRGPHGAGVFEDHGEKDPRRRYKMFYQGMAVRFSADGLRWSDAVPCPQIDARGDTHNNAFWAPELNKYVGITRLWDGQRIVGRTESADFVTWTPAVEVLRGETAHQTYAMPVFRYADVYLGLLMILRRDADRVHCELTWSPDTVEWKRIDPGTPLIPNSETEGAYDWGCVYGANDPIVLDEEIRLYYGGSNGQHGGWRDGFLCLATLRVDGFAGYEPARADRPATVLTGPIVFSGPSLRVTADAAGGSVRVTVLDIQGESLAAGHPISGDMTDEPVRLVEQDALRELKGQPVRLKFELNRAKLYSFAFGE